MHAHPVFCMCLARTCTLQVATAFSLHTHAEQHAASRSNSTQARINLAWSYTPHAGGASSTPAHAGAPKEEGTCTRASTRGWVSTSIFQAQSGLAMQTCVLIPTHSACTCSRGEQFQKRVHSLLRAPSMCSMPGSTCQILMSDAHVLSARASMASIIVCCVS